MRCEQCGRDMQNAELWQVATDPKAPTSWSMKHLCWDCREHPQQASEKLDHVEDDSEMAVVTESLDRTLANYRDSLL